MPNTVANGGYSPQIEFPAPQTEFPVFNPGGKLMGNLTGNYGQPPSDNLPGSTLGTISGATVSAPAGSSIPNAATISGSTLGKVTTPQSSPQAGSLGDLLARGVIIVLGFIFIAVGLNMLRPGTVPIPNRPRL